MITSATGGFSRSMLYDTDYQCWWLYNRCWLDFSIPSLINPSIAQLNPICRLLALLGTHHILHVSRIRVKGNSIFPIILVVYSEVECCAKLCCGACNDQTLSLLYIYIYMGADKLLARPGRKQANVSDRMAWISFGALPCRKQNLDSSRLDVVEIARLPDVFRNLFPTWSG